VRHRLTKGSATDRLHLTTAPHLDSTHLPAEMENTLLWFAKAAHDDHVDARSKVASRFSDLFKWIADYYREEARLVA